jgi:hypothetical protein
VVSGQWSVVSGQWSVVSGQWSVVSGQWSVKDGTDFRWMHQEKLPFLAKNLGEKRQFVF